MESIPKSKSHLWISGDGYFFWPRLVFPLRPCWHQRNFIILKQMPQRPSLVCLDQKKRAVQPQKTAKYLSTYWEIFKTSIHLPDNGAAGARLFALGHIIRVGFAFTSLGQNNSSLFYNRIDSMNCVMGHSMGGGSAFLAAQFSPSIKSLVTLAPAETNPSAIQAAAILTIPALIFAGGNDCITPPPANQIPMYGSLQSICKTC